MVHTHGFYWKMDKAFIEKSSPQRSPSLTIPMIALGRQLWDFSEMVKIEHTVFALPFALSGLYLSTKHWPHISLLFWTVVAFTGARCAAMSLNRVIDAELDIRNPRTSNRAVPQGKISKPSAVIFSLVSFGTMIFASTQLPSPCLQLSPLALFWLSFYSFSKRFTWLCHLFLGIALGGAALGGWLAGGGSLSHSVPWVLALAVTTWVAGFDIIYACLDFDFDRKEKLFSLPAAFGLSKALNVSSILHIITVLALIWLGFIAGLGICFWFGVTLIALALIWEHALVSPNNLKNVNAAFFNINGLISILVFFAIVCDKMLHL